MAYSQQTTHYGLPLPTSGDKSTFLDTNDAFGRIDSDIYEAKTSATAAVQDIGQIQLDVSQLKASTLEMQTDISQLTSRQTISETNITALQSAMSTAQADVTKLQNDYGTTDISDIGDGTVTGAISALAEDASSFTVTTSATDTYSNLLDKVNANIDKTKITMKSTLEGRFVYHISMIDANEVRYSAVGFDVISVLSFTGNKIAQRTTFTGGTVATVSDLANLCGARTWTFRY